MITGFSEQTKPLSDYEREVLVPIVANGMLWHQGRKNAVTSSQICQSLRRKGFKIDGPRLRKVMNHIRINGLVGCVIAKSEGYWVSDDTNEIREYIQSLEERASSIMAVSGALSGQLREKERYNEIR